ncbi:MAG: hypothetical protein ISS79_03775 [Phycisphaerae bacterium]|nr:hypothetical protein [Phycisphaerae bacterium]
MNRTHIAGKMNNRLTILIFAFLLGVPAFGAGAAGQVLLRDGFPLTGVEGKLIAVEAEDQSQYIKFEENEVWLFRLEADVNDYRVVVKGPVSLQLLPSTALEKIIADAKEHPDGTYRLWGRITKYKGANYIFGGFFLPVVEMAPVEPVQPVDPNELEPTKVPEEPIEPNELGELKTATRPEELSEPNEPPKPPVEPTRAVEIELPQVLTDPNGVLEIPKEVLEKLSSRKIIVPRKMKPRVKAVPDKLETRKIDLPSKIKPEPKPEEEPKKDAVPADKAKVEEKPEDKPEPAERPAMKLDSVLADRTATLLKQDNGRCRFVLDALGLSVQELSLQALPNEVLELTEARQIAELNRVRFKIAGIKTEFKGNHYLLLQKATRVYGHGNFGN